MENNRKSIFNIEMIDTSITASFSWIRMRINIHDTSPYVNKSYLSGHFMDMITENMDL